MPRQINPEKGYIVSANHKLCDIYPERNTFSQGYRAWRLETLIQDKIRQSSSSITFEDAKRFQQDDTSIVGLEFQKRFLSRSSVTSTFCKSSSIDDILLCDAFNEFKTWNGSTNRNSAGAIIYETTFFTLGFNLINNFAGSSLSRVCMGQYVCFCFCIVLFSTLTNFKEVSILLLILVQKLYPIFLL